MCYHHFLIIPDAERTLTLIPLLPSLFQTLEFILSCSPSTLCWVMGPPAEASSISRGVLWEGTFVCGLQKGSRPWSPQHLTGTEELRDLGLMSSQPSQFRLVPVGLRVQGTAGGRECQKVFVMGVEEVWGILGTEYAGPGLSHPQAPPTSRLVTRSSCAQSWPSLPIWLLGTHN